jgi:hypothetical protein
MTATLLYPYALTLYYPSLPFKLWQQPFLTLTHEPFITLPYPLRYDSNPSLPLLMNPLLPFLTLYGMTANQWGGLVSRALFPNINVLAFVAQIPFKSWDWYYNFFSHIMSKSFESNYNLLWSWTKSLIDMIWKMLISVPWLHWDLCKQLPGKWNQTMDCCHTLSIDCLQGKETNV